jgi:DNA-binding CsgD family transcriptional regulator
MKGDLLRVIEAAYADVRQEDIWLRGIVQAAQPVLDSGLGVTGYSYTIGAGSRPQLQAFVEQGGVGITQQLVQRTIGEAPLEFARATHAIQRVSSLTEFLRAPTLRGTPFLSEPIEPMGFQDTIGIVGVNPSGQGIVLSAGVPEPRRLSASFRRTWVRMAVHLAAGLRMRSASAEPGAPGGAGETEEAVLDLSGKLHHASGPARDRLARVALRQAARAIDRARSSREKDPEAAVALWRGLVEARWSLVDSFDADGRHFLIAQRNTIEASAARRLSERERQVTALASLGRSNKVIAYELGLSLGTVATLLSRATRKLGVSSRVQLIDYWQRSCQEPAR